MRRGHNRLAVAIQIFSHIITTTDSFSLSALPACACSPCLVSRERERSQMFLIPAVFSFRTWGCPSRFSSSTVLSREIPRNHAVFRFQEARHGLGNPFCPKGGGLAHVNGRVEHRCRRHVKRSGREDGWGQTRLTGEHLMGRPQSFRNLSFCVIQAASANLQGSLP